LRTERGQSEALRGPDYTRDPLDRDGSLGREGGRSHGGECRHRGCDRRQTPAGRYRIVIRLAFPSRYYLPRLYYHRRIIRPRFYENRTIAHCLCTVCALFAIVLSFPSFFFFFFFFFNSLSENHRLSAGMRCLGSQVLVL
jgi:hypothetical protein